mgnify:CR=1 FL=1
MYAYASQFKKPNKNTGSVVRVTLFAFFKEYCQGLKVFFLTGCVKIFFSKMDDDVQFDSSSKSS